MNLEVEDGLCIDDTSITVLVDVCTGIPGNAVVQMEAFPVPTTSRLQLKGLEGIEEELTLGLVDVAGRQVFQSIVPFGAKSAVIDLDLQSIEQGVYFLTVQGQATRWQQKIVIVR